MKNDLLPLVGMLTLASLLTACQEPAQNDPQSSQAPTQTSIPSDSSASERVVQATTPTEVTSDERKATLKPANRCNLERANDAVFAGVPLPVSKSSAANQFSGWLADSEANSVPARGDIRFVHNESSRAWKATFETGGNRPDVVKLLGGDAGFSGAGYRLPVDLKNLPAGQYRLYVVYGEPGALHVCDNGRSITLS